MIDGFATPEELGVSREDYIKSTQKSNERIRKTKELTIDEMLEEAAKREEKNRRPFYRFFAMEYFGTGEGITYYLQVCRNYVSYDDIDRGMDCFRRFIDDNFFAAGIEELEEEEFRERFAALIPAHITKMIDCRDQPQLMWQTHFHVNYS